MPEVEAAKMANVPEFLIVHCSDSGWGDASVIDAWHRDRGFDRLGYHRVILNGFRTYADMKSGVRKDVGLVELGRLDMEVGAHCVGYNSRSLGICLVGSGVYPVQQIDALRQLVNELRSQYDIPVHNVIGHHESQSGAQEGKTCPSLDRSMIALRMPELRQSLEVSSSTT